MPVPEGKLYNDKVRCGGEIAGHLASEHITSKVAEGTIIFGQAVVRGTEDPQVKTPAAAGNEFMGVAGFSSQASDIDNESYLDGDPLALVQEGIVVVYVEEAVTPDSPVRVRHTAGAGTAPGAFCTTAEAGKTAVLKGAEFKESSEGVGYVTCHLKGIYELVADTE